MVVIERKNAPGRVGWILLREPWAPSSIAVAAKAVAWTRSELVDRLIRRRRSNVQTTAGEQLQGGKDGRRRWHRCSTVRASSCRLAPRLAPAGQALSGGDRCA